MIERDVLISGRRVHFLDAGADEHTFVLVHGMGGHSQHWYEVIPALAARGRVLAIDLPGFGDSELPAGGISLDGFADIAAELIRSLEIDRAVLVGHSMGGPIAIRFAARHPELAEAIVMIGGAVYQFSALLGMHDLVRFARERPRETAAIFAEIITAALPVPALVGSLVRRSPWLRRLVFAPYVLDPSALSDQAVRAMLAGAGAPGVLRTVRAIARSDPREGIADVHCPILSVAADLDRITPLGDSEAFQREVPRARTAIVEGSGHMIMLERPEELMAAIGELIDELDGAATQSQRGPG